MKQTIIYHVNSKMKVSWSHSTVIETEVMEYWEIGNWHGSAHCVGVVEYNNIEI